MSNVPAIPEVYLQGSPYALGGQVNAHNASQMVGFYVNHPELNTAGMIDHMATLQLELPEGSAEYNQLAYTQMELLGVCKESVDATMEERGGAYEQYCSHHAQGYIEGSLMSFEDFCNVGEE